MYAFNQTQSQIIRQINIKIKIKSKLPCLNLYALNGLFYWCTQVPEFWLAENFTV